MYRTKTNSYYSLLFASFVAVVGCGSEDDDADAPVEESMEPDTVEDAGKPAAALDAGAGKADAAVDAMVAPKDAMVTTGDATTVPPDASTSDATLTPPTGNFEHGETIAADNNCAACHRANFAGAGLYPNITPDDATGVGSWTDKQLSDAITKGLGKDGTPLCSIMAPFDLSDGEVADLIAYIRGIPAVKKANAGGCD
jgi:mono/diheme cytochrome c family protein